MQSFNREFTLCIWHRRSPKCGGMFADSSGKFLVNALYQVKVRFDLSNGWQNGQAQSIHIRWLGQCCWAAKSLTRSQSGWRRNVLPNKTLDTFKSFQGLLADSQEHHGLQSAIPTLRFALRYHLDLLRFQNIPARRHTYLDCWQHVVNAPKISQSYFCVVRPTHNSDSWA